MSEHKQLIESFYEAFSKKDYVTMRECYHPEANFLDPGFDLKSGKEAGAMWHMLCERGKDMKITWSVTEDNGKVRAHWEPTYTFSQNGRFVHNIIDAEFEFRDGKIYRHTDTFDFWRWSKQSLGLPGYLLGWSSFLKNKVRTMAMGNLKVFIEKHPEYQ